ncbi:hypothetical protein TELCIR_08437 [Teladorsagia circumcincta]|uniref:Small acidic protein-like domain-containing protein n=1 Tax=Teladorsagia circumcincta TaxID=45464 RepID=A0A2G9UHL7_TELCI|nr:hypothetical protein TELCIR_08437 [Teladorsagia circumcincta]
MHCVVFDVICKLLFFAVVCQKYEVCTSLRLKLKPVLRTFRQPLQEDSDRLKEESEKQKRMMRELDRQYEIAREATHMGRGLGLGFHQ